MNLGKIIEFAKPVVGTKLSAMRNSFRVLSDNWRKQEP